MARPFPTTFEKESSPLTPLSSGSNTPISYRANVNRQKTKKWADAKPADYGGDDWGDDDGYDLPPPKPTGLRQQGQALPGGVRAAESSFGGDGPPRRPDGSSFPPGRTNSFDNDDERRKFSSGISRGAVGQIPPPTTAAPATRFSQMAPVNAPRTFRPASGPEALSISTEVGTPPPVTGLRKASLVSPASGSPHPDILQPGRVNSGDSGSAVSPMSFNTRSSSSDYQGRRDFSPSAVPSPLQSRASPAPLQSAVEPSLRYPGRKSSLSNSMGVDDPEILRPAQEPAASKPWAESPRRSSSPNIVSTPASPPPKVLPFIRPADIYRRMEEEREKERKSMESSRPSIDSISGMKSSDTSESPAKINLKEKSSSDSLGLGPTRRRSSFEGDDASDSGRRLMPMLEPVEERKSEYGFDGFDVNDQLHSQPSETTKVEPAVAISDEATQLDVQQLRRQSTSPQLPDFNRMSGFGTGLFSYSDPDSAVPVISDNSGTTPSSSSIAHLNAPNAEDLSHRNQPSPGFRSIVHQAFDRSDESSLPDTPASRSGSGIRRNNSESTGTAGISPIISRVPSTGATESRNRDPSTPSVLEVVNESTSPSVGSGKVAVPGQAEESNPEKQAKPVGSVVIPGYRRDISTPSPGNNPARSPDMVKSENVLQSEHAVLSAGSESSAQSSDNEEPSQTDRQAFKSNPSNNAIISSQPDIGVNSMASPQKRSPANESSATREHDEGSDSHLTPTTSQDLNLVAGAITAVGAAGVALDGCNKHSPVESPGSANAQAPSGNSSLATHTPTAYRNDKLPTSTPSTTVLQESSSPPPSPPPKYTSLPGSVVDGSEKAAKLPVQPTAKPLDPEETIETPGPPSMIPQLQPTSSTDRTSEEENEKLRDEIVKRLSPRVSDSAPSYDERFRSELDDPTSSEHVRESTYLPSEYDNYWASTAEDDVPAALDTKAVGTSAEGPPPTEISHATVIEPPSFNEPEMAPIPPLSTHREEKTASETRPTLPKRFSWEDSVEDLGQYSDDNSNLPVYESHQGVPVLGHDMASSDLSQAPEKPVAANPENESFTARPANPVEDEAWQGAKTDTLGGSQHHSDAGNVMVAGAAGTAAVAAGVAAAASHEPAIQTRAQPQRPSLTTGARDSHVSSYSVSPASPESDHPAQSTQSLVPPTDSPTHPISRSSASPINTPLPVHVSPTVRIPLFKEIAAIKAPQQRIHGFNEARRQFATMDSGLTNWMSALKAQHTEHSGVTRSWSGAWNNNQPNTAGRSKYSRSPGGLASPTQESYYQQYLNASSPTTPSVPTPRAGPTIAVGAQPGASAAGGKLSGQQVQAKGKEFLHTAGVFGGKAGKAGKGLLAKGKNRLRGSGGGDKTTQEPKPKTEHRSSWGFPLHISRSTGPPDATSGRSRQSMPVNLQQPHRPPTTTSGDALPAPLLTTANPAESPMILTGGPRTPDLQVLPSGEHTSSHVHPERRLTTQELVQQTSKGVSAPVAENGSARDASSAYSTAGEEQIEHGGSPKPQQPRLHAARQPEGLRLQDHPMFKNEPSSIGIVPFDDSVNATGEKGPVYDGHQKPPQSVENSHHARGLLAPGEGSSGPEPSSTADVPQEQLKMPLGAESRNSPSKDLTKVSKLSTALASNLSSRDCGGYEAARPISSAQPERAAVEESSTPVISGTVTSIRQAQDHDIAETSSFKSLPPIRRVSKLALGFGLPTAISPVGGNEDNLSKLQGEPSYAQKDKTEAVAAIEAPPLGNVANNTSENIELKVVATDGWVPKKAPAAISASHSQGLEASPSEYGQRAMGPQRAPGPVLTAPRPLEINTVANDFRRSRDAWRPNVPNSAMQAPPGRWNDPTGPPQRSSFDSQRNHSRAGSGHSVTNRPESQSRDRMSWSRQGSQQKPIEQPPSSAERYPDLFRLDQSGSENARTGGDLPDHLYQAPIHREDAFLPRQQINEYQLPGVGPPVDSPPPTRSRRNSSFLRDLGGKITRTASRERAGSLSREAPKSGKEFESDYPESFVASDDGQEQKKRTSFLKNLNRTSTSGLSRAQSRDSMEAHHPGSRTDLLISPEPTPLGPGDRKGSFFTRATAAKSKPNKLSRSSTAGQIEETGKKKRFSGLSGMFGRSSSHVPPKGATERPQATKALSQQERQPLEPLQYAPRTSSKFPLVETGRPPSQKRNLLSKMSTKVDHSQQSTHDGRSRRASASGLLGGILGRRSSQLDREQDSSGSQQSDRQSRPHQLPPAQTYTDLEDLPQDIPLPPPEMSTRQNRRSQESERGRFPNRKDSYQNVPLGPGGHNMTHGQRHMVEPTGYGRQGVNSQAQYRDPRYSEQLGRGPQQQNPVGIQGQQQHYNDERRYQRSPLKEAGAPRGIGGLNQPKPPDLQLVSPFIHRDQRRLSREDLLARSPARVPEGQQPPYQLSLPGDTDDNDEPNDNDSTAKDSRLSSRASRSPTSIRSPPFQALPDAIQRLSQPVVRHPQSPASYPLPDDETFSPINPSAQNIPAPPPPKWGAAHNYEDLNTNLDRSNTRYTAASGKSQVSQLSAPRSLSATSNHKRLLDASPTPPSPQITPERRESPETHGEQPSDIRTTVVDAPPSPDLYDATPREKVRKDPFGPRDGVGEAAKEGEGATSEKKENENDEGLGIKSVRSAQEEKIYYNRNDPLGEEAHEEEIEPVTMSATSYPGQEWNPYVGYEEGFD